MCFTEIQVGRGNVCNNSCLTIATQRVSQYESEFAISVRNVTISTLRNINQRVDDVTES